MIGRDMWVAREKFFPILENVKSGKDNTDETNAEKNPEWQDRFGVRTNDCKERAHQWMTGAWKNADRMSAIASRMLALPLPHRSR